MYLPPMGAVDAQRDMLQVFKGYNHNLRISDGEFYNQKNMSCRDYPMLAPRARRGTVKQLENPQGTIEKDAMGIVDGRFLWFGDYKIDLNLSVDEEECPKQLVSMGAYLIVFPDGKYINTQDHGDCGSIDTSFTTGEDSTVTFTLCRADGTEYKDAVSSETAPGYPEDGMLWINTGTAPHTLNQYSEYSLQWVGVATTYVKIQYPNIGENFRQYDGVAISGCKAEGTEALNQTSVVWAVGKDYIVVIGILDRQAMQTEPVTVTRKAPKMDYVTEGENRLWGCRYGFDRSGKMVNEIYACKLGDFKNWNCFMGTAADSYAVSVGSDGVFTGAAFHLGYPVFFKENCFHKIYGSYPSNYQVQTTRARGVEKGSSQSLCAVNEILYYKSRDGVCAYDGSLPVSVSGALGNVRYREAYAGKKGDCYYVCMKNPQGEKELFCYDTSKGIWTKEDKVDARFFVNVDGDLYFVDALSKQLCVIDGANAQMKNTLEDAVEWSAQTGDMGLGSPDSKYISKLTIRASIPPGGELSVFVRYDTEEKWQCIASVAHGCKRSFSLPVPLRRCDHFRLKLSGKGECRIYSITKTIQNGSDMT